MTAAAPPAWRRPWPARLLRLLAHRHTVAAASMLLLLLTLGVVMFTVLRLPLKDDVAWLLYVARRWMAGRELYTDLVEVNPPLIVWISAVPIRLAGWLGVAPEEVAMPFFIAMVLGCAWWTSGLLRGTSALFSKSNCTGALFAQSNCTGALFAQSNCTGALFAQRMPVFAVLGTVLLAVPGVEVGQREHLLIAACLPFLALFARELDGMPTKLPVAMAAGILAGLGCALKPRYVVVFAVLEALALLRGRFVLRPLTLSAVATLLLYGGSILAFCPNYMRRAVPLALALYGATDVPALQLMKEMLRLFLAQAVAGGLLWLRRRTLPERSLVLVLLLFAATSTVVCVLDGKNWFYHRLPATVATVLALLCWAGSVLVNRSDWPRARSPRLWLPLMLACAALGVFAVASVQRLEPEVALAVTPEHNTVERLEALIRREKAHRYIAFSEWIALGFPVVNNTGVVWTSRFDSMWALKGELWRVRFDPAAAKEWPIRRWVAHDFVTGCPDLAVVDRRGGMNYVAVLSASDAGFARAWARYRLIDAFDGLEVYRRGAAGCTDPVARRS